MSWQDVKDQVKAVQDLRAALDSGRLPHAVLFLGAPEAGQMKAALELAKSLVCVNSKKNESCGVCIDCRQIDKGLYSDLHLIRPEEDTRVIKVDQAREIIRQASLKPLKGHVKVFIIDSAECLNEIAQNALLKTLEEPEAHTYFILIAYASESILVTLRSRLRTYHFISTEWSASDESGWRAAYLQAKEFVWSEKPAPDFSGLKRDELMKLLDNLILDAREVLILKAAGEGMLLSAQDLSFKEKMASRYDTEGLMEMIELLADFKDKIGHSVNIKLALWVLWDEIAGIRSDQRMLHAE